MAFDTFGAFDAFLRFRHFLTLSTLFDVSNIFFCFLHFLTFPTLFDASVAIFQFLRRDFPFLRRDIPFLRCDFMSLRRKFQFLLLDFNAFLAISRFHKHGTICRLAHEQGPFYKSVRKHRPCHTDEYTSNNPANASLTNGSMSSACSQSWR